MRRPFKKKDLGKHAVAISSDDELTELFRGWRLITSKQLK